MSETLMELLAKSVPVCCNGPKGYIIPVLPERSLNRELAASHISSRTLSSSIHASEDAMILVRYLGRFASSSWEAAAMSPHAAGWTFSRPRVESRLTEEGRVYSCGRS